MDTELSRHLAFIEHACPALSQYGFERSFVRCFTHQYIFSRSLFLSRCSSNNHQIKIMNKYKRLRQSHIIFAELHQIKLYPLVFRTRACDERCPLSLGLDFLIVQCFQELKVGGGILDFLQTRFFSCCYHELF